MFSSWFGGAPVEPVWKYDDLASPTTDAEFLEVLAGARRQGVDDLEGVGKWVEFINSEGIVCEEKIVPDAGTVTIIRSRGEIPCSAERLFHLVWDAPFDQMKVIGKELLAFNTVRMINDNCKIIHSQYQAPMPVSNREFVTLRGVETDPKLFVFGTSINYQPIPFTQGFERGVSRMAYRITPITDSSCLFETVDQADPKGWIPPIIVNAFKSKAHDRIKNLRLNLSN